MKNNDKDASAAVIRKTTSFKRIRGLLTGDSKRKNKDASAKGASERAKTGQSSKQSIPVSKRQPPPPPGPPPVSTSPPALVEDASVKSAAFAGGDEESTVYGVDVDDRSAMMSQADASSVSQVEQGFLSRAQSYLLKVVLLLLDPETRRFELLQLEFDSNKAMVADVLAQIPLSLTEPPLRKISYSSICGSDGIERTSPTILSTFCQGNDILVAVADSVTASECARLARPILSNDKVSSMVSAWMRVWGKTCAPTSMRVYTVSHFIPRDRLSFYLLTLL
jgi:hypothetical protein